MIPKVRLFISTLYEIALNGFISTAGIIQQLETEEQNSKSMWATLDKTKLQLQ